MDMSDTEKQWNEKNEPVEAKNETPEVLPEFAVPQEEAIKVQ